MNVMTDTSAVIDATRIAALKADCAAARKRVAELLAENETLRQRNAALKDGLRPFAMECAEWVEHIHLLPNETVPEIRAPSDDAVAAARFTLGDLRRARALLAGRPTP